MTDARELVAWCLGGSHFGSAASGIALIGSDIQLSHQDLAARVRAGAATLTRHGVRPGQFVGVPAIRSADTMVAILAIWAAGAAYCPIDPAGAPPAHIAGVLDTTVVPAAITAEAAAGRTPPMTAPRVPDTAPAYLMATSGSSGAPKTTVVTRGGLREVFKSLHAALAGRIPEGARWTQLHPLTFGYSVCELLGSLVFGGQLVLIPREDPLTLAHLTAEINGHRDSQDSPDSRCSHVVCLTPSELAVLVERVRSGGGRLPSHIVLSGEAAHKAPLAEVFALDPAAPPIVVNTYAATETSGQITAHVVTPATVAEVANGYVGSPLPGVDVTLRRPDGQPVAQSDTRTIGQIHVGGPTLAFGYLDPTQTRQRFVAPPERAGIEYATGDLGQWSGLGGLRVVGRADRMAKLGGRWLGMEEVERLVAASDLVVEVAACTGHLGRLGRLGQSGRSDGPDSLFLMVVPTNDNPLHAARLRDDVVRRLPLRVTVRLATTDRIPRLPNGKVDMAKLVQHAAAQPLSEPPAQHIRGVGMTIRAQWNALLGVGVATDKNLFEMGVDSVGTITAAARLSDALGFPVSPEFLLANPRIDLQIAELKALINGSPRTGAAATTQKGTR